MEIRGKVHEVGQLQNVTDSFKKRDLILAYAENPQFVEYIRFEATQDRVSIFDGLKVGEEVEVSFNLRGRPWTNAQGVTTYFNSLVAWRVTKLLNSSSNTDNSQVVQDAVIVNDGGNEDLPF